MNLGWPPLKFLLGLGFILVCFVTLRQFESATFLTCTLCIQIPASIFLATRWICSYRYGAEPDPARASFAVAAVAIIFTAFISGERLARQPIGVGHLAAITLVTLVAAAFSRPLYQMWPFLGGEDLSTNDTAPARFASNLPIRAVVKVQSDEGSSNGFIVHHKGLIVTTAHGTYGAKLLWVTLANGEAYPATLLTHHKHWDLAVLKIEPAHPLPAVKLADSTDLTIGAACVYLGYEPRRVADEFRWGMMPDDQRTPLIEPAAIPATLSGITETSEPDDAAALVVATQSTVRPGYSGAPLVDRKSGRVIGVHSGGFTSPGLMRVASPTMVVSLLKSIREANRRSLLFRMPIPDGGMPETRTWEASAFGLLEHQTDWLALAADESRAQEFAEWRTHVNLYLERVSDHPACIACQAGFAFLDGDPDEGLQLVTRTLEAGLAQAGVETLEIWVKAGGDLPQAVALVERVFADEPILLGVDSYRVHQMARYLVDNLLELNQFERVLSVVSRVRESARAAKCLAPFTLAEGRALIALERFEDATGAIESAREQSRAGSGEISSWAPAIEAYLRLADSVSDEKADLRAEH